MVARKLEPFYRSVTPNPEFTLPVSTFEQVSISPVPFFSQKIALLLQHLAGCFKAFQSICRCEVRSGSKLTLFRELKRGHARISYPYSSAWLRKSGPEILAAGQYFFLARRKDPGAFADNSVSRDIEFLLASPLYPYNMADEVYDGAIGIDLGMRLTLTSLVQPAN